MSFSKTRSSTLNKSMCFYPQLTEFPPSSSSFRRRQSQLIKVGRCFSFQLLAQLISTFVGWTLHLVIYANESSFYAFHHLFRVSTSLYKAFFYRHVQQISSTKHKHTWVWSRRIVACMQPQNLVCLQQIDTRILQIKTVILQSRHQLGK